LALKHVTDVQPWPSVARELSSRGNGPTTSTEEIHSRLKEIVHRRNKIAHEADRDPERHGAQRLITDHETTSVIDWIEQLATAILGVIGPPPADLDEPAESEKRPRRRWTRPEIDQAVLRLDDQGAKTAVLELLKHADTRGAMYRGGVGVVPTASFYYRLYGTRRSLWSLYLEEGRPLINLNIGTIAPADRDLTRSTPSSRLLR
jgi:hypothetical protein